MSEDQVQLAATFIMEDHKSLNVSDLIVIFKDIIKGKYGKMYDKHAEIKSNTYIGERTSEQRP